MQKDKSDLVQAVEKYISYVHVKHLIKRNFKPFFFVNMSPWSWMCKNSDKSESISFLWYIPRVYNHGICLKSRIEKHKIGGIYPDDTKTVYMNIKWKKKQRTPRFKLCTLLVMQYIRVWNFFHKFLGHFFLFRLFFFYIFRTLYDDCLLFKFLIVL